MDRPIESRRRRLRWFIVQTRVAGVFMIFISLVAAGISAADLLGLTHNGSPKAAILVWLGFAALSVFFWDLFASRAKEKLSALPARNGDTGPPVDADRP